MADKLCLGVTAREVVQILTMLDETLRVEVLRIMCGMVLDPERKWVIMDFGFKGCSKHTRAQAIEVLQDMSVRGGGMGGGVRRRMARCRLSG